MFGDIPSGWTFGRMGRPAMRHPNSYSGLVDGLAAGDLELLHDAVRERMLREEAGFGTPAKAVELYRPSPACPSCGEPSPWRDGSTDAGVRRWRCPSCGARFSSLTGTVLERRKKPLAAWVDFVRLTLFAVPPDVCAEMCRTATRPPGSGATASSPPWTATRTGSSSGTASESTRPT